MTHEELENLILLKVKVENLKRVIDFIQTEVTTRVSKPKEITLREALTELSRLFPREDAEVREMLHGILELLNSKLIQLHSKTEITLSSVKLIYPED